MENQGYRSIENERKANEVRKLMNEAYKSLENRQIINRIKFMGKATDISKELKDYLCKTYPTSFNIKIIRITNEENDELFDDRNQNNIEKITKRYNINLYDIVYVISGKDGIYLLYSMFYDENGIDINNFAMWDGGLNGPSSDYIKRNIKMRGPYNWYKFLERMGLLSQVAADLYNKEDNSHLFYDEERGTWPCIGLEEKNKL